MANLFGCDLQSFKCNYWISGILLVITIILGLIFVLALPSFGVEMDQVAVWSIVGGFGLLTVLWCIAAVYQHITFNRNKYPKSSSSYQSL